MTHHQTPDSMDRQADREELDKLLAEVSYIGKNAPLLKRSRLRAEAKDQLYNLLVSKAETLYEWQEGSGYASRKAIPITELNKMFNKGDTK